MLIKYILNLITRRFSPRLAAIANIANSLRVERNIGYISFK
jgi:hypothetical protein